MAHKNQLSRQRAGTVINNISKLQEPKLQNAVVRIANSLARKYNGLRLDLVPQLMLVDVISILSKRYPEVDFCSCFDSSSMRPDGGILSLVDASGSKYPILISEKKNQGTNDLRELEGKPKQAKGNAIERLGKNVIGFRTALMHESIFPFVCFGDGCDFSDTSSIIDRVKTIAMFGSLNKLHLHNVGTNGCFNRGTYYFRVEQWTEGEMYDRAYEIAERSVLYYFSKYGKDVFFRA